MIVDAPAKLNLFLRVLAREAGGFHQIETLFCALELADELEIERSTLGIEIDTTFDIPTHENIVYRAATAFFRQSGLDGGARIRLTKRIPSGAGLGGGSSDAAATLAALNELYARPLDRARLIEIAATLGSDVPFFLCGSPLALAWGRGTRMLPLEPLPMRHVVLVAPSETVNTAVAYTDLADSRTADYAARPMVHRRITARTGAAAGEERWNDVAYNAVNDFEPVIFSRIPELSRIKADLLRHGARMAMMTGSGSVVFGVFGDDISATEAANAVQSDFRNVQTIVTRTADRDLSLWSPPPALT
jgi:4-diphosphocytidyl-2-C-methyl-D-erythritol kinase